MASNDETLLLAQQKEAVNILCKSGPGEYGLYLERYDILDFLNEEEKQYITDLQLETIIYTEEDDEAREEQMPLPVYDDEVCTSLEIDSPSPVIDPVTKIKFTPGICNEICKVIKKSTSSIKIAMFMFTDPKIFEEICTKKIKAGSNFNVQILVDDVQWKSFMDMAKKVIKNKFGDKEIGIIVKSINRNEKYSKDPRSGRAHEKFLIADDTLALTGSYNFTWASEHLNYEQMIITRDKEAIVAPLLNHYKKISKRVKYEIL